MAATQIQVGHRYIARDARSVVWEVARVFMGRDGVDYAELRSIRDRTRTKSISCAALERRADYERVSDG
ncbi:MAG: hypothetical protein HY246_10300 [Proteobacteria bacterium]|jgi:hypothetical protein|nr:hypothetical protein [Pseudomonadota bacterium]